jgi:4,5-dihydroxyphthalate decarboxylase
MLKLGCVDFMDRTRPILDGQVQVPGLEVAPVRLKPMELLGRFTEFDVCEIPLFAHLALRALGDDEYVGLPVFPHRGFPHGSAVVHDASGIGAPQDLAGRRVGTPGLFLSGTVWMRGILEDDYGVASERIRWVIPALPRDSVGWRITQHLIRRSGIQVEESAGNLSEMLEKGELDAWIGPLPPESFERGAPRLRRLFTDYKKTEQAYAARKRFVPALHTVIVRRRWQEKSEGLVELFRKSREVGYKNFQNDNVFAVMLPWMRHHLEELKALFDGDWVPAGLEANRSMSDIASKYAARQGLTAAP